MIVKSKARKINKSLNPKSNEKIGYVHVVNEVKMFFEDLVTCFQCSKNTSRLLRKRQIQGREVGHLPCTQI